MFSCWEGEFLTRTCLVVIITCGCFQSTRGCFVLILCQRHCTQMGIPLREQSFDLSDHWGLTGGAGTRLTVLKALAGGRQPVLCRLQTLGQCWQCLTFLLVEITLRPILLIMGPQDRVQFRKAVSECLCGYLVLALREECSEIMEVLRNTSH